MSTPTSFATLFDHQQFAQYPSEFTAETFSVLRTLLSYLLEMLVEIGQDQTELHMNDNQQRLVQYLSVLIHFTRYTPEKLLLTEHDYLHALCSLVSHAKLMEDHTSNNGNKLLIFILLQQLAQEKTFLANLLNHEHEFKQQLPMCLIIVDHEDQELISYNRLFLFIYYNILKQLCLYSWPYCKHLANHKNMSWALKNVLPYVQLYHDACEQLLSICKAVFHRPDELGDADDEQAVNEFKKELFSTIYRFSDLRSAWTVILDLTRDICDLHASHEDRLLILHRRGLPVLTSIFFTVYALYHDQTHVHTVQDDLIYLLSLIANLLDTADTQLKKQPTVVGGAATTTTASATPAITSVRNIVGNQWKEKLELVGKLLLLLNSYNSSEIRQRAVDLLKKIIVQLTIQDLTTVASHVKSIQEQVAGQSHSQLGPCKTMIVEGGLKLIAFFSFPDFPRRKQSSSNAQQQQGNSIKSNGFISESSSFRSS